MQVGGLLLGRAVLVQRCVGTVGQAGVHGPRLVGAVHHLVQALVDGKRQALAAELGVAAQCRPATFHVGFVGFLEACGGGDFARLAVVLAALGVAADVEREDHLRGKLARLFQHSVDGVNVGVRVLRNGLEVVRDLEHLVHHELHVAQWGVVNGHVDLLLTKKLTKQPALQAWPGN